MRREEINVLNEFMSQEWNEIFSFNVYVPFIGETHFVQSPSHQVCGTKGFGVFPYRANSGREGNHQSEGSDPVVWKVSLEVVGPSSMEMSTEAGHGGNHRAEPGGHIV